MQEDQRGLLPILGPLSRQRKFYHDKASIAMCHDKVFRVATGFSGQAHYPTWARATDMRARLGRASDIVTHARQRFLVLCRNRVPRHIGRFGS